MGEVSNVFNWERIETFIGYGRRAAPIVFLGMEEGGTDDDEQLSSDLKKRSNWKEVEELTFGKKIVRTWRPMCDLMLRRDGCRNPTREDHSNYQNNRLGKDDGDSLLTELLPYPTRKMKLWPYNCSPYNRDCTRKVYERRLIPARQKMLVRLLAEAPREIIVAYGKGYWPHYKELFKATTWSEAPPFEVGEWKGARVVLAHHFSARAFNGVEQLNRFAEVCGI